MAPALEVSQHGRHGRAGNMVLVEPPGRPAHAHEVILFLHEDDWEEGALIGQLCTEPIGDGHRRGLPPEATTHEAEGGPSGVVEPSLTEVERNGMDHAGWETSIDR
jgi:hypothetical protein